MHVSVCCTRVYPCALRCCVPGSSQGCAPWRDMSVLCLHLCTGVTCVRPWACLCVCLCSVAIPASLYMCVSVFSVCAPGILSMHYVSVLRTLLSLRCGVCILHVSVWPWCPYVCSWVLWTSSYSGCLCMSYHSLRCVSVWKPLAQPSLRFRSACLCARVLPVRL